MKISANIVEPGLRPMILTVVLPSVEGVLITLDFEVYENRELLQRYQYEFREQWVAWGPLLAFLWVNWLTTSKQDAFTATLLQFIQDAHRDGYL